MPLDLASQENEIQSTGKLDFLRVILLASVVVTVIISLVFFKYAPDNDPSPMRVGLRINHNITSVHIKIQEYFQDDGNRNPQEIIVLFDRAAGYVEVMLHGGEIDGVVVDTLEPPERRKEIEEIGKIIHQMKTMVLKQMEQNLAGKQDLEFAQNYDDLYLSFLDQTNWFISSCQSFNQRYHQQLEQVQFFLLALVLGLVFSIAWISRNANLAKAKAWHMVRCIEERRGLAITGAKLGTWDWNIATGDLVVNERWAEMIGLDPRELDLHLQVWERLVHPDDFLRVSQELEDHLAGKTQHLDSEYRMQGAEGRWVWILDLGKVLEWDSQGNPLRAAGIHLDISDVKEVEFALRMEKEKAQKYLDLAGVIFVAIDNEGIVQMINREGCQVLGYAEEDIVGLHWMENFVPQRYRFFTQNVADGLLSEYEVERENLINPVLTASGDEALIAWRNTKLFDDRGKIIGHLSSGSDITKQRKHELDLQKNQRRLQSLASQLALTEDHLRQEIAAGLHDSIGQNLAALKLSVDIMHMNMGTEDGPDVPDPRSALETISKTIDEIVQEIWSLSFQLCPPGLQESGIVSALEWLMAKYNDEHDCVFNLIVEDSPLEVDRSTRGLLFQMIRELLINSIKHGHASEVDLFLARENDFLLVTVADNGKGFDPDEVITTVEKSGGFGLFSIRERLAFISGRLDIESTVGEGARVVIHFPLEGLSLLENGEK